MAKINGVELKSLKHLVGHGSIPMVQASLYVDGKKVGTVLENPRAMLPFSYALTAKGMRDEAIDERLFAYADAKGFHPDFRNREALICLLLDLTDFEKVFKAQSKKYPALPLAVVAWQLDYALDYDTATRNWSSGMYMTVDNTPDRIAYAQAKIVEGTTGTAVVFTSLTDFQFAL